MNQPIINSIYPKFKNNLRYRPIPAECTTLKKASSIVGGSVAATERSIDILRVHPEFFISYYNRYNNMTNTFELDNGKFKLIARKEYVREKGKELLNTYFFTYDDCPMLINRCKGYFVPIYPHAVGLIDIAWEVLVANNETNKKYGGVRDNETNRPAYKISEPFKTYDKFMTLSKKIGLSEMHALDMGAGIGNVGFIGSLFFREFTCVENFRPIYDASLRAEVNLRSRGSLKNRINIINTDFTRSDFDMSLYGLICIYRPFLDNSYKILNKLHEANRGTLVFSNQFPEIAIDREYEKVSDIDGFGKTRDALLFKRK